MVRSHGGTLGRCAFALLGALLLACAAESSPGGSPSSGSGGQTPSGGTTAMSGGEGGRGGSPSAASGGAMVTAGGASSTTGGALGAGSGGTSAGNATGGNGTSAGTAGEATGGTAGGATGGTTAAATGGTAGSATGGTTAATGGTAGAATGGTAGGSKNGGGSAGTAAGGVGGSGGGADAGKVVLFDGKNLDSWQNSNGSAAAWRLVTEAAAMEVAPGTGNIITKQKFGSMFLHIEYWTPAYAASVTGQNRGNSGIYVKRAYEFQVLDSFGQPPADDTCGAIYKTSKPLVSACYGAEMWNTYEIEFKDSTWNGNVKSAPAEAVSVHLNGQLVQENVRLTIDPTTSGVPDSAGPQPLMLQDHDGRVRYRNIWAIPR